MKQGLPSFNTYTFNSMFGETVPLNVTNTTSSVKFALQPSLKNYDVIVTNSGTSTVFINFGLSTNGTVTATLPGTTGTTGATPILAGAIYTFQKNSDSVFADTCAGISNSAVTCTVYFTSVQGS
jgi:hypothetical protein